MRIHSEATVLLPFFKTVPSSELYVPKEDDDDDDDDYDFWDWGRRTNSSIHFLKACCFLS